MRYFIVQMLLWLLCLSQTVLPAAIYPHHSLSLPARIGTALEFNVNDGQSGKNRRVKRAKIPDLINWGQDHLGTTWSGFIKEPKESGWDIEVLRHYVKTAYEQTQCGSTEVIMVAGLWVYNKGIYLGTVPHGTVFGSGGASAQSSFDLACRLQAPVLWKEVERRTYEGRTKWHAEDMAMYTYEVEEKPQGPKYPQSFMAVYGKYNAQDTVGFKRPCNARSRLDPSCGYVLQQLGIRSVF